MNYSWPMWHHRLVALDLPSYTSVICGKWLIVLNGICETSIDHNMNERDGQALVHIFMYCSSQFWKTVDAINTFITFRFEGFGDLTVPVQKWSQQWHLQKTWPSLGRPFSKYEVNPGWLFGENCGDMACWSVVSGSSDSNVSDKLSLNIYGGFLE